LVSVDSMLIVAGSLFVHAIDRETYLALTYDVARLARATEGCLDFVQAADPLDPTRINVFERWESEAPMLAFRGQDGPEIELPEVVGADVKRYVIASVDAP
jgi:quinol monooxygenase YgiN